jgi:hypothetical protein
VSIDLPLGVLTTLAVLTCALAFGHIRDVSQRRIAEEKGLVLLKQWLSPAQLAQYEKSNYFEVTGGDSGKRYRIRSTHQMNVDELDERGLRSVSYCFGPEGVAVEIWMKQKPTQDQEIALRLHPGETHVTFS